MLMLQTQCMMMCEIKKQTTRKNYGARQHTMGVNVCLVGTIHHRSSPKMRVLESCHSNSTCGVFHIILSSMPPVLLPSGWLHRPWSTLHAALACLPHGTRCRFPKSTPHWRTVCDGVVVQAKSSAHVRQATCCHQVVGDNRCKHSSYVRGYTQR